MGARDRKVPSGMGRLNRLVAKGWDPGLKTKPGAPGSETKARIRSLHLSDELPSNREFA